MEETKKITIKSLVIVVIFSFIFGGFGGAVITSLVYQQPIIMDQLKKTVVVEEQSGITEAVQKVSPSVVSIVVSADVPKINQYGYPYYDPFFDDFIVPPEQPKVPETERQEIGSGSGFVVSKDGYIVTNRHVVSYDDVEYTVFLNDGTEYQATVVDRDSVNDIAVLKVDATNLQPVEFGDSSNLKVGQTVIAIGNALGEFSNTVSRGVISGLSRSLLASGSAYGAEQLVNVIQTDASINQGNSGGPLLNIEGQVIGINTAVVSGAQNIGFAIPINDVINAIESVKQYGEIVRPWLGVRYVTITPAIAQANNLSVDYGALIVRGQTETDFAVSPGSPADKVGLTENDIILKINGEKVDNRNPLNRQLTQYDPNEEVTLTILRQGNEKTVNVKLGQFEG